MGERKVTVPPSARTAEPRSRGDWGTSGREEPGRGSRSQAARSLRVNLITPVSSIKYPVIK